MKRFIAWEASGSVALLGATVVALAWANSPWSGSYDALLHLRLGFTLGGRSFSLDLHHWVNDGLMAVFFFVVGLEIKRELVLGRLSTWKGAALPVVAAIGGMVVPAALYAAFNGRGEGGHGWGIPVATDIAFSLGVLTLLGSRVPLGLKVFLTALAIADDIGAVTVISIFYTETVRLSALAGAGVLLFLLWLAGRRFRVRAVGPYAVLVVGVWAAMLASGVHATVAGVLIAALVPVHSRIEPEAFLAGAEEALAALRSGAISRASLVHDSALLEQLERLHEAAARFRPPAVSFERALHPFSTWVVLPLFALFNSGVRLEGAGVGEALRNPVALGVVVGLFAGKQIGITLASWLVIRLGLAKLPDGITLRHLYGVSVLAGIGFTMSIFVAELAFADPALVASAKLGILAASLLAGVAGYLVLLVTLRTGRGSGAVVLLAVALGMAPSPASAAGASGAAPAGHHLRLRAIRVAEIAVPLDGTAADVRARVASEALARAFSAGERKASFQREGDRATVRLGGEDILVLGPDDALAAGLPDAAALAASVAGAVGEAVAEEDLRVHAQGTVYALSMLVFSALVAFLLGKRLGVAAAALSARIESGERAIPALRMGGVEVVSAGFARGWLPLIARLGGIALQLALLYGWLLFAASLFDRTRPLGSKLTEALLDPAASLLGRLGAALPVLAVLAVAAGVLGVLLRAVRLHFDAVARDGGPSWVPRELARPTGALVRTALVVAVLIVLPDLLGLSVQSGLRGLAFAALLAGGLGAAPLAGNLILGIFAVYGRSVRPGDHAEVAGRSGRVVEVTLQDVRLEEEGGAVVRIPHLLTLVHPVRVRPADGERGR